MTILSELSADVLGEIIDSSKSFYMFLRLWLCGSKTLNSKIAQGVTRIRLEGNFPKPNFVLSKFPRSVLSLHNLRRLTIKAVRQFAESSLEWSDIIKLLPPTLERLHLSFPGSKHVLVDYEASCTSGAPLGSPLESSTLIDLHTLFPNLHTLHIDAGSPEHHCGIPNELLSSLPPTLTRLGLGRYHGYKTPLLSILPRNLTRLDSGLNLATVEDSLLQQDWSLAPPNLHRVADITTRAVDSKWLPKTIVEGRISEIGNFRAGGPSLDFVRGLPSKLTTLSLPCYGPLAEGTLESLPSSLIDLSLEELSVGLQPAQLRILPATLRFLKVAVESLDDERAENDFWPPNLQTLFLTPTVPTNLSKVISRLPHSINRLTLCFTGQMWHILPPSAIIVLEAPLLPKDLTSLTLMGRGISSIQSPLPPLLQDLDMRSLASMTIPLDSYPASLKCFRFYNKDLHTKVDMIKFPPCLTTLELARWRYDWLHCIPKTVTHLIVYSMKYEPNDSTNQWADLPVGLKTLETRKMLKWPQQVIDAFDFSSLVNLETLKLRLFVNASKQFSTLPRGLIHLELGCKADPEFAEDLPRLLRSCVINWKGGYQSVNIHTHAFPLFALKCLAIPPQDDDVIRARYQSFL